MVTLCFVWVVMRVCTWCAQFAMTEYVWSEEGNERGDGNFQGQLQRT